ncbi:phosphatidylinositol-specific phospholipase C [Streptomyces sp. x-19]|uniref:phosphatidylinositol-specific phospholipase C n=1 Tax=Streptomyces sp. x-19 TaxID=2789280 RepID=UPI00397F7C16
MSESREMPQEIEGIASPFSPDQGPEITEEERISSHPMGEDEEDFLRGQEPLEFTGTESMPKVPGGQIQSGLNNWMSGVPDSTNLKDMTIPGTHQTCAQEDDTAFGLGRCQGQSLEWQLNNGVRFIDIRCYLRYPFGVIFEIFHGSIDQHLTFSDVLNVCKGFLSRNPSETILMLLSEERSNYPNDFRRTFNDWYLKHLGWESLFYDLNNTSRIPDLGEVRNKIVLFSNQPYLDMGLNFGSGLFDTQNDWNGPSLDRKKNAVQQQLYKAMNASPPRQEMYINYTSATGPGLSRTPWGFAKELNPWTLAKINESGHGRRYGVILMDWVDRPNGLTSGGYVNMMSTLALCNPLTDIPRTNSIRYRGADSQDHLLKGGDVFLLYWMSEANDGYYQNNVFYPVGLWEGKDMSGKKKATKEDVVQFRFNAHHPYLDSGSLQGVPLEYRVGNSSWRTPMQRKGAEYYFAATGDNTMRSIERAYLYGDPHVTRFALRMDIVGKGDSWISADHYTTSIRMRDTEGRRAYLVAVHYGDTPGDPFGSKTVFEPISRQEMLGPVRTKEVEHWTRSTTGAGSWTKMDTGPSWRTEYTPAIASYNGSLHAVFCDSENKLMWTSYNGTSWTTPQQIRDFRSQAQPALAVWQNKLFCAHLGMDDPSVYVNYYAKYDNYQDWHEAQRTPLTSFTGPALVALSDGLNVVAPRLLSLSPTRIYIYRVGGDGNLWGTETAVLDVQNFFPKTVRSPAACYTGERLRMALTETDDEILIGTLLDKGTWDHRSTQGESWHWRTDSGPAMTTDGSKMWLAHRGGAGYIHVSEGTPTPDGTSTSWGAVSTIHQVSKDAPALTLHNNTLHLMLLAS